MDRWAYSNSLANIHPVEKFIFSIIPMILALIWDKSQFHIFILIEMIVATVLIARIPIKTYGKYMAIPLAFLMITSLTIAIEINNEYINYISYIKILNMNIGMTYNSLKIAAKLIFRVGATLSCLYFFALTTPMQDIIYLLEKAYFPLIFTELMVLIYRYIFVFLKTSKSIYYAQATRNGYVGFARSLKSLSILSSTLFIKAYIQSKALYQGAISRGYKGTFYNIDNDKRISKKRLSFIILFQIGLFYLGRISK